MLYALIAVSCLAALSTGCLIVLSIRDLRVQNKHEFLMMQTKDPDTGDIHTLLADLVRTITKALETKGLEPGNVTRELRNTVNAELDHPSTPLQFNKEFPQ